MDLDKRSVQDNIDENQAVFTHPRHQTKGMMEYARATIRQFSVIQAREMALR